MHLRCRGQLLTFELAPGAGALDLFADLSGSSGSQAAQAAAEAAAQSTAVSAEGVLLSRSCCRASGTSFGTVYWCRSAAQIPGIRAGAATKHCSRSAGQLQSGQRQQGQADDLLVGRDYASRVLQG